MRCQLWNWGSAAAGLADKCRSCTACDGEDVSCEACFVQSITFSIFAGHAVRQKQLRLQSV